MGTGLFAALDRDWLVLAGSKLERQALDCWREDSLLGDFESLAAVVAACHRRDEPAATNELLAALVARAAGDRMAARTVLQALIPGLVRVTARLTRFGPVADVPNEVVVEAFARICGYPLERRPRAIAANVLWDTHQRVSRRLSARGWVTVELTRDPPEPETVHASGEVIDLLAHAVTSGHLNATDAWLLHDTAFGGDGLAGLAEREGVAYDAMRMRVSRARRRLHATVA